MLVKGIPVILEKSVFTDNEWNIPAWLAMSDIAFSGNVVMNNTGSSRVFYESGLSN